MKEGPLLIWDGRLVGRVRLSRFEVGSGLSWRDSDWEGGGIGMARFR